MPEIIRTDNGPQFKSKFEEFSKQYNFEHITSSPYYSQSNGCAEAAVKIAKNLLKKNDDIYLALLVYHNTPLESGFSPAELMFGRKLRDNLPRLPSTLNKTVSVRKDFNQKEKTKQEKIKYQHNKRHRTRSLSKLQVGDKVWVIDLKSYGEVVRQSPHPRSYIVRTKGGLFRRNRWHLIPAPYREDEIEKELPKPPPCDFRKHPDANYNSGVLDSQIPRQHDFVRPDIDSPMNMEHNSADLTLEPSERNRETLEAGTPSKPEGRTVDHQWGKRVRHKPSWLSDYVTE